MKLTPSELETIVSRLNHGVECELKHINDNLVVIKTKRQMLFKDVELSLEQMKKILTENPNSRLEFKLENGKVVAVLVNRRQIN